jgi:hypothetical protein
MREKLDALGSSAGEIGERDGRETRHKRERETAADRVVSAPLQSLSKQTQGRRGDGNKGVQI